jgi:hypothetical protein
MLQPVPVDGTFLILSFAAGFALYLYYVYIALFFPPRRNKRDCDTLKEIVGYTNVEQCTCSNHNEQGVDITCKPMQQKICMTPTDESFCTSTTSSDDLFEDNDFSTVYTASSSYRTTSQSMSPPITAKKETTMGTFVNEPDYKSSFDFVFYRGNATDPSSPKYVECYIDNRFYLAPFGLLRSIQCMTCSICDSGVDFKYDCSDARGFYTYNNKTKKKELGPGPIVESCIPIADMFPSF